MGNRSTFSDSVSVADGECSLKLCQLLVSIDKSTRAPPLQDAGVPKKSNTAGVRGVGVSLRLPACPSSPQVPPPHQNGATGSVSRFSVREERGGVAWSGRSCSSKDQPRGGGIERIGLVWALVRNYCRYERRSLRDLVNIVSTI